MALEENNTSRDYLYGRLLAVAEHIEQKALRLSKERRTTTAERLMQRFSNMPYTTWLTIEESLLPYQARIKSKYPPIEEAYKRLLDEIHDAFDIEHYKSKERLYGEYLLGFHCQRKWLHDHKPEKGQWVLRDKAEIAAEETVGD